MKKFVITATIVTALALQPVVAYADTIQPTDTTTTTTTVSPSPSSTSATDTSTSSTTGTTALGTSTVGTTTPGAITGTDGQPVDPGTLPSSPFYWFTSLIQKLQVALTFDPVKKAQLEEKQALQNLAAAQKLLQQGNTDLAQQSLTEYSNKVQQAQQFLTSVQDPNSPVAQTLLTAMTQTNAKNIQVLGNLLDKLPPQASEKLALNVVRSMEKAVNKMTEQQKQSVQQQVNQATQTLNQPNLDEQAKQALAEFRASLGEQKAAAMGERKGKENDQEDRSTQTSSSTTTPSTTTAASSQTVGQANNVMVNHENNQAMEQESEQNKERENNQAKEQENEQNKEQENNQAANRNINQVKGQMSHASEHSAKDDHGHGSNDD